MVLDTQQASKQCSLLEILHVLEHSLTGSFAGLLLNPLVTDLRSGKAEISFAGSLQVGPVESLYVGVAAPDFK